MGEPFLEKGRFPGGGAPGSPGELRGRSFPGSAGCFGGCQGSLPSGKASNIDDFQVYVLTLPFLNPDVFRILSADPFDSNSD